MSIHFIDGKCHIKQLKAGKSHTICLTNDTWYISHHITPMVINAQGEDTHTYQLVSQSNFKNRHAQHAPGLNIILCI